MYSVDFIKFGLQQVFRQDVILQQFFVGKIGQNFSLLKFLFATLLMHAYNQPTDILKCELQFGSTWKLGEKCLGNKNNLTVKQALAQTIFDGVKTPMFFLTQQLRQQIYFQAPRLQLMVGLQGFS
eukprot:TRINITY_DN6585_c1_g3_i3.p5 TRINITY_DN6585_c1_g3~~TRINITY_DN6585_c1_g3_i3.p5  ORF type:complete len:125 (-),score=9.01 TRINITY_DN6585_c1_g3_i3:117-491(-)